MLNNPYPFCPDFDFDRIVENDAEFIWNEAVRLMQNGDRQEMDRQVEILAEFFRNPVWTQFVNLDKYPYLKGAIEGYSAG